MPIALQWDWAREAGEGKDKRGIEEGGVVAVAAKEGIDAGEAVDDFVPRGRAGYDLDEDCGDVHVTKGPGQVLRVRGG